ncbi:MAG: alpha/beta hydrolase [Planctomycetota bacterium]|nr:alpha/beta hydrolase [Planctomycetota bacterium]
MEISTRLRGWSLARVLAFLVLSGCGAIELMDTPTLFTKSKSNPFRDVPAEFRTNKVEVLYVTDRTPVEQEGSTVEYTHGRSPSLAYGTCTVEIGKDVSWEVLVENSLARKRSRSLPLALRETRELGRFPETPFPLVVVDEEVRDDPTVVADHKAMEESFQQEVRKRLEMTPLKEAFVFIHGVNCKFEGAAILIAQVWHYLGREGVPIAYTWPAAIGGARGYFYDRESGEFTVHHLKQFLRMLSACEDLEKIHIISHSRGAAVGTSAIRELFIEAKAGGRDPMTEFKIGHLILIAPDMDLEVVGQRITAERVFLAVEKLTVYVSQGDRAIGFTSIWFRSHQRLARLRPEDLSEKQRTRIRRTSRIDIIDVTAPTGFTGHSYFYTSPEVSSDLILLLRDGKEPGAANGRPLIYRGGNFWELPEGYPTAKAD